MSKTSRLRKVSEVKYAHFVKQPDFTKNKRLRGVQRTGDSFEKKVQAELAKMAPNRIVPNAWIEYYDACTGLRHCSPDILDIDVVAGVITIVECKLSFRASAFDQLEIYKEVVSFMFPGFTVRGLQVCKNLTMDLWEQGNRRVLHSVFGEFEGTENFMVWQN